MESSVRHVLNVTLFDRISLRLQHEELVSELLALITLLFESLRKFSVLNHLIS